LNCIKYHSKVLTGYLSEMFVSLPGSLASQTGVGPVLIAACLI